MVVVVGVDESPLAEEVLARAIEEAKWRGAELHVVNVFHLPFTYVDLPIDFVAIAEGHRSAVWGPLEEKISGAGVEIRRVDIEGYPPDSLVSYANDVGASLLVLGTRGRGELGALILGSTSHRAIHLAACDVLIVKRTTA
ncbi:MAG: universal stress protein [Acidimicrobiia bacterium]